MEEVKCFREVRNVKQTASVHQNDECIAERKDNKKEISIFFILALCFKNVNVSETLVEKKKRGMQ